LGEPSELIVIVCENCGKERTIQRQTERKIRLGQLKNLCKSCSNRLRSKHAIAARDKIAFVCPDCGEKRTITGQTLRDIKSGRRSGRCKSCAERAKKGYTIAGKNKVLYMCPVCKQERVIDGFTLRKIESGKYSGLCRSCGARSRSKRSVAARDKVPYICPSCGEERTITGGNLWLIEDGKISGDCKSCALKGIPHLNSRGQKHHNWKGGMKTVSCKWCNKKFEIAPCHIKKGGGHFCSLACRGKAKTGENATQWKGGVSFEPYAPTFNKALKTAIRERDSYTCVSCGDCGNHVHHIDYDKDNSQWNNLVTLCDSCHGKSNHKRASYMAILSDKVSDMPFAGFAGY